MALPRLVLTIRLLRGTLVFNAGQTSRTFTIAINADTIDEANETVNLTLSNPIGSLLGGQNTALLTITDNDAGGALRFKAATYSVSEVGPVATITVTRSGGTASAVTVAYATSNGTASAGSDYSATSGTLSFTAGQISRTFTVPITNDTIDEANETVNLVLSNPTGGATLGTPGSAVLPIVDNDTGGALRFSAATYSVSEVGPLVTITVTRSGGTASAVTVAYATGNGTAGTGSDYTATSGTLTFNAGETSKSFTIPILNDGLAEGNETVNLTLSNPTGSATLSSPITAVLTVVDDEVALQLSSAIYTVSEAGIKATITVTRSGPTSPIVGVTYATSDGTASAGSDYGVSSGTLSFTAGQISRTFTVPITNDTIDEANETVNLILSNPTGGAQLGPQNTALLTITDNDAGGVLRFKTATYSVSEVGPVATITVTRSGGTASAVTVAYATSNGTASAGSDYSTTSGTLNFTAGQISRTFTVPITNDTIDEANETVNLILSNPTGGATLGTPGTAVLTIVDNDTGGALRFSAATYSVSEVGPLVTITVTRSGGTASAVTVAYATGNGTAGTGSDYTATSGTLTFNAGETSKSFTIPILNDGLAEGNETVNLTLSNPTGSATLSSPITAVLTLVDDEVALQLSSAIYTVSEAGIKATITVTRSGPTSPIVGVTYATSDGTASAGSDYGVSSGTLSFTAGQISRTFTVPITNDTIDEANETVNLILSNPTGGAQLGPQNTALLTITDNDAGGVLRFKTATYSVSEVGPVATITVTRSGGTASAVTVAYATSNGTASAGSDYSTTSGTLNFTAGQISRTFTVPITNDTIDEANETVNLILSNPTGGATLGTPGTAVLTIVDNDT